MAELGQALPENRKKWQAGLRHELQFWEKFLTLPEWQWHRDARFGPAFQFPDFGRELLGESAPATIDVLDVGSGPASTIGLNWPGHTINLTTVDPLAPAFNALLRRCGYAEKATILQGLAEDLHEMFERDKFDLVYCGNALDHTHAPLRAISNMMDVVKPGGWLVIICYENEGEFEAYTGLHQWNLCIRDRRLTLWNDEGSIDVFEQIVGCDRHRARMLPPHSGDTRNRIMASVRKPRFAR